MAWNSSLNSSIAWELMADCLAGFYLRRRGLVAPKFTRVMAAIGLGPLLAEALKLKFLQMEEVYSATYQRAKWFMQGWVASECQTLTVLLADLI